MSFYGHIEYMMLQQEYVSIPECQRREALPPARFNKILWQGMKGSKPYPFAAQGHTAEDMDD